MTHSGRHDIHYIVMVQCQNAVDQAVLLTRNIEDGFEAKRIG